MRLDVPWIDLTQRYEEDYLIAKKRERTVNRSRLKQIRERLDEHITPAGVDTFLKAFPAASTRNRQRALLKHMLAWANRRGWVTNYEVGWEELAHESEHNERTRRLLDGEESRLVAAMDPEMADLFYAALDTGLRRGALLALRFTDVGGGVLHVRATTQKHKEAQAIPLTKRLAAIVERRRHAGQGRHSEIFHGAYSDKRWNRACRAAGVEGLHWHDLRAEFASRLSEKGVDVVLTSRLLGHASLHTTQRYLRSRLEQFREAIESLEV